MILPLIVTLTLLLCTDSLYITDIDEQHRLFGEFKTRFGKSYTPAEEAVKLSTFLENLKLADARNQAEKMVGGSAIHGITQFSDLTSTEFRETYLKLKKPDGITHRKAHKTVSQQANVQALVDWTGSIHTFYPPSHNCND